MTDFLDMEMILKAFADDGRNEMMDILYRGGCTTIGDMHKKMTKNINEDNMFTHMRKLVSLGIVEEGVPARMSSGYVTTYKLSETGRELYGSVLKAYEKFKK